MNEQEVITQGKWQLTTTFFNEDKKTYTEWVDNTGKERKKLISTEIDRMQFDLVYLPTQKKVLEEYACLKLTSVGEYEEGPSSVWFSDDGKHICVMHKTYLLSELEAKALMQ